MERPETNPAPTRKRIKQDMDAETIYKRIGTAVLERRLLPGAKLAEGRLSEATGASRMKVRQVLARLAHEQIVTLVPNRGAYISQPTAEEARQMFEVRCLIEPPLVASLCRTLDDADIERLRAHVRKEREAREADDLPTVIRLSGEFHILLAEMTGNEILMRLMRELTALTCLIITLYDKPDAPACPQHEHSELVRLIEARDVPGVEQHMLDHLRHIEQTLNLDGVSRDAPDFEAIFSA